MTFRCRDLYYVDHYLKSLWPFLVSDSGCQFFSYDKVYAGFMYLSGKVLENLDALFSPKIPACIYTPIWIDMGQADGALGEHLTTMWIHFTGLDGFSRENTRSIYFKWSSVIFLKNLDFYFLFLTFVLLFKIHEFKFWL